MEDSRNDLEGRIGSLDVRGDAATAAAAADGGVGTVKGAAKAAGEDAVDYSDRVLDQTRGAYLKAKRVVAKTKAHERRSALDAHEVRVLEAYGLPDTRALGIASATPPDPYATVRHGGGEWGGSDDDSDDGEGGDGDGEKGARSASTAPDGHRV